MGSIDWSTQPPWLISLIFFGTGVVVPIVLALIGRSRAKPDAPPPAVPLPVQPVEVNSPWLVQNISELVLLARNTKASIDALTSAVNALAIQLSNVAARRRH